MKCLPLALFFLLPFARPALSGEAQAPPAEKRPPQPIPDDALLPDASALVHDFFKADFSKADLMDREKLAGKLLLEAAQTNTDMDLKYVLLREAYDVARQAGLFPLAIEAARAMAKAFQVDETKLKTEVFSQVNPSTPEGLQALVDCILNEVDAAAAGDRYAEALQLLDLAKARATKVKDATLHASLNARGKELQIRQTAFDQAEKARETLTGKPDDAVAHLALGTYLCFYRNDWETGLAHLVKGSDTALKNAATHELQPPAEPVAMADLGDQWWALAEKQTGRPKEALQQRALARYVESLAGLPPARQATVLKRLQSLSGLTGTIMEKLKSAGLVFCVNPAADPTGKARDLISFAPPVHVGPVKVGPEGGSNALKFSSGYASYAATGPVKTVQSAGSFFVWIRHEKSIGPWAGILFRGTAPDPKEGKGVSDFALFIHEDRFRLWFNWPENEWPGAEGKTSFACKSLVPIGRWVMCGATWNGTAISLYMDGKRDRVLPSAAGPLVRKFPEIIALGCDPAGSNEFYLGSMSCAMIFDRALTDAEVLQLYNLSRALGLSAPQD